MNKILSAATLFTFILIGGFGFMHMYLMEGHMPMPTCPFMPGHEAVCTMDALGHIEAWQHAFTAISANSFVFFLTLFIVVTFFILKIPKLPDKEVEVSYKQKIYKDKPTLYQLLFSQGVLNPKAP